MSDESDSSVDEKIHNYLFDKRRTRDTVSIDGIDQEIDRGVGDLVRILNDSGFVTLFSCSGLMSEHYPTAEMKEKFEERKILDVHNFQHTRPFVTTEPRYHSFQPKLEVDNEFYTFVNQCVYPSKFGLHIRNISRSKTRNPEYVFYRDVGEVSEKSSSIDEFDDILTNNIQTFKRCVRDFY
jgi:hypothetical protein